MTGEVGAGELGTGPWLTLQGAVGVSVVMAELYVTGEQTWESLRRLLAPGGSLSSLSLCCCPRPFTLPLLASLRSGSCLALASSSSQPAFPQTSVCLFKADT